METRLQNVQGLRVAVEGCGHGTLNAIYESVKKACEARQWDGVDLLIIGGDFQAIRNANDLVVMSCPVKYHAIGDFHAYYSGTVMAPYLTIFVGGNHEASSHMWELYYGGWAAPNIYYLGAANVVRVGGIRIAGMSGIWKGYNYNKPHYERLPYNQDDIKSIYHIRELDVRKLLQLTTQVDIGISHDWPKAVEWSGDHRGLFRSKPFFEQESKDGTLGSTAAAYVMDRLRPPYWFSAHMHVKFAATRVYDEEIKEASKTVVLPDTLPPTKGAVHNEDEIDLDMDDEDPGDSQGQGQKTSSQPNGTSTDHTKHEEALREPAPDQIVNPVSEDLRAQLPAAFSRPAPTTRKTPGQPVPADIKNRVVRFLALDKCLPGRKFLQLLEVEPHQSSAATADGTLMERTQPKFEYDPEWLAITRVFAADLVLGDKEARTSPDLGEEQYRPLIEKELRWVQDNIVNAGRLEIPRNFVHTAPTYEVGTPEIVSDGPIEYSNPQTQQYCDLVGIDNRFAATEEERMARMQRGPAPLEPRAEGRRGGGGGHGGNRGGGRGRHRGRGGGNGGGRGRGRGRGW